MPSKELKILLLEENNFIDKIYLTFGGKDNCLISCFRPPPAAIATPPCVTGPREKSTPSFTFLCKGVLEYGTTNACTFIYWWFTPYPNHANGGWVWFSLPAFLCFLLALL
jgi:hypothetical protein